MMPPSSDSDDLSVVVASGEESVGSRLGVATSRSNGSVVSMVVNSLWCWGYIWRISPMCRRPADLKLNLELKWRFRIASFGIVCVAGFAR